MNWKMPANVLVTLVVLVIGAPATDAADPTDNLASPESFASIADNAARSAAMFTELGKVLTNPRCVNCHPAGDRPRQGEQGRLHQPPVQRGADGHGLPAMRCSICHQQANFDPAGVPGHPEWHLAPREVLVPSSAHLVQHFARSAPVKLRQSSIFALLSATACNMG